jgi:hypothetical protein
MHHSRNHSRQESQQSRKHICGLPRLGSGSAVVLCPAKCKLGCNRSTTATFSNVAVDHLLQPSLQARLQLGTADRINRVETKTV